MDIKKIDSHQHFWKFDPVRDSWITGEMKVIKRDFLPQDLEGILLKNNFEGCVVVQADQSEEENIFQLKNADEYDFVKGVVGWVDLQSVNVEERLEYYSQFKKLKGFRHILQGEPQRDLMLEPAFMRGIKLLKNYNFTYDILIFHDQLTYLPQFVSACPDQRFVIDHIAKPAIEKHEIDNWKKGIIDIAKHQNVYCKISGMVTEASWATWKKEDFKPYLDTVVEAFGTDRIMFGSDWPVCLLAATYEEVLNITEDYFSSFSKQEQEKFFRLNAILFYDL